MFTHRYTNVNTFSIFCQNCASLHRHTDTKLPCLPLKMSTTPLFVYTRSHNYIPDVGYSVGAMQVQGNAIRGFERSKFGRKHFNCSRRPLLQHIKYTSGRVVGIMAKGKFAMTMFSQEMKSDSLHLYSPNLHCTFFTIQWWNDLLVKV